MGKLQIHISNFRAIEDARIALNGITVLTGLNATGKSTISRMMYYAGHYASHYQELIDDRLAKRMESIVFYFIRSLDLLPDDLRLSFMEKGYSHYLHKPFSKEDSYQIIAALQAYYEGGAQVKSVDRERLGQIFGKKIKNRYDFLNHLDGLKSEIDDIYDDYNKTLYERPSLHLLNKLVELFDTSKETLMNALEVREEEVEIISSKRKSIGLFASFDNVFYINTPVIANFSGDFLTSLLDQNWVDLIKLFYNRESTMLSDTELEVLAFLTKITHGQVELPSNNPEAIWQTRKIYFTESSGESYAIKEVATGIKSFALIQSLLQKGLLTERTLLIIDEPEAHLHPQWTVEYARIITTLHRELGVKFLLATHSPRLVQSLSLFASEEEETAKSLLFYMSEPTETTPVRYRFRELTEEEGIEPIFSCFNTAYDVMNQYVVEE